MAVIYVRGPATVFDEQFAEYEQGIGHYFDVEFKNLGGILRKLDNTEVILEEEESKFLQEHLDISTIYTHEEVQQYLEDNKADWFEPDPIGGQ